MAVKQAYTLEEGMETLPTDLSILDSIPEALKHMSNAELLRKICTDRMKALGFAGKPEYEERLERELGVILGKGFSVYFIMIYDIMKFCRDEGIVYGVGRGSACGSLVSYLLRITGVDPLEYNLLFERFLDESRSDMPDIDIDVQGNRRAEVKRYIERTYGHDHVAGIATYGYYQPAAAFKAAARVLGVPYAKANDVTINDLDDIPSAMEAEFPGLKMLTKSLIGQMANTGRHAAGVVVSDRPLTDYASIETRKIPNEDAREAVVAMDKKVAEAVGLVKIDLLGLNTLSVVDDAIRIAEESGEMKVKFDWKNMKQDDPAVYKMLSQGYTASVFQAEESASTNLLGKMKVEDFTELYTSNALVRSGAWNAFGEDYIATLNGKRKPWYPTEESKEFLEDTLGFCVPGDQEIMTPAGPVKMKDIEVLDKVCGEFDENIVLKKVDTGSKECVEIATHDGRVIQLSEDHPVKTIDGWKKAGDLTDEDYLVEGEITLDEDRFATNSEAVFLAGAIAEGYLSAGQIPFSSTEDCVMRHYEEAVKNTFSHVDTYRHFNTRCWYVSCKKNVVDGRFGYHAPNQAVQYIRDAGLWKTNSATKFIPDAVFRWNSEAKLAFLGMYLMCDGSLASESSVGFRTISWKIATGLRTLAISTGCDRVYMLQDTNGAYTIIIYDADYINEKLMPHVRGGKNSYRTPGTGRLIDRTKYQDILRAHIGTTGMGVKPFLKSKGCSGSAFWGKASSEKRYERLIELTGNEYQRIDRVKSVKRVGLKPCYDIQVTGDHTFLVDDIVTHNCTFQEQSMLLCQEVAGMSAQDSNAIRRLTAKKEDPKLLAPYKDGFIRGCIANGVPKEDAQRMWHDIEVTSEYQFNKCLAGDTTVTTKQYGDIEIKELYEKFNANPNAEIQVLGPECIRQRDVGEPVWHNVKDVMFQGNRPTVRVRTSSDTYIDSTYNHRHRLTKTWKQAGRIWQHDRIVTINGAETVYDRRYNGYQDVYDIELASEPHAFYANGFVTHNSHAVAYSLLTYATAYLKRYYPGPWMTAVLNNESDTGKISTYLAECRRLGIDVKVPHVNKAEAQYSYKDGAIYMGLSSVKFISDKSAEKIIAQRPYESYKHFQEVVFAKGSGINSRMSASLNAIGALEFDDNPTNAREAKMNYFEILGIPSFDDIMLPEKMKQRLTPLSEFSGKKVQIIMGIVNDITSKANWSRADLIDDESSATFFMNSPDQLKKGHRYVCLVAENSLMDAVDLSDLGDNAEKHPLMRWLNGSMDDGTYIIGGSFRVTKSGKDMATAVYSHNGELRKFLVLGDKVKTFKQTCKRGTKVLRLNLSPDGVWFNGARV